MCFCILPFERRHILVGKTFLLTTHVSVDLICFTAAKALDRSSLATLGGNGKGLFCVEMCKFMVFYRLLGNLQWSVQFGLLTVCKYTQKANSPQKPTVRQVGDQQNKCKLASKGKVKQ